MRVILVLIFLGSVASANCNLNKHIGAHCYEEDEENMSRFFVGFNAGWIFNTMDWGNSRYPSGDTNDKPEMKLIAPTEFNNYTLGANFGYKHALSHNLGFRYYIDYFYYTAKERKDSMAPIFVNTQPRETDMTIRMHNIALNIDFYFQLRNSFGFYAGFGLGVNMFNTFFKFRSPGVPNNQDVNFIGATDDDISFSLPINAGLTYQFLNNHSISLNAKISSLPLEYHTRFTNSYKEITRYDGPIKNRFYNVTLGYTMEF